MVRLQERYGGQVFQAVAVLLTPEEPARLFARDVQANYVVLADARRAFAAHGIEEVPSFRLVDPDGKIAATDLIAAVSLLSRRVGTGGSLYRR